MYAHLKGTVEDIYEDACVIDVGGVGYRVLISAHTRQNMHTGQPLKLHIETVMRAESLQLFGFLDTLDLAWFRLLTTVQGVGPKLALGILGSVSLHDLSRIIMAQDKTMMTRAEGVGPKLAGRILLELKDKNLPGPSTFGGVPVKGSVQANASHKSTPIHVYSDTLSALENLGYRKQEAKSVLDQVMTHASDDVSSSDLLRLTLQALSPVR